MMKSISFSLSNTGAPHQSGCRGVTLLELLVALAIVAILGVIAIPSYVQYVTRANRSSAKSLLLQVADREEQYFADHKSYATDLTLLGYTANPFYIDDTGATVLSSSADRVYAIALSGATATMFTIKAIPQLRQATRDTACGTLTLNHVGAKGPSVGRCW